MRISSCAVLEFLNPPSFAELVHRPFPRVNVDLEIQRHFAHIRSSEKMRLARIKAKGGALNQESCLVD